MKTMSQLPPRRTAAEPAITASNQAPPAAAVRTLGPEVPLPFFVLLDLLSLLAAFQVAYVAAPRLKRLLLSGNRIFPVWVSLLSTEPAGTYRPMHEMAWALLGRSGLGDGRVRDDSPRRLQSSWWVRRAILHVMGGRGSLPPHASRYRYGPGVLNGRAPGGRL